MAFELVMPRLGWSMEVGSLVEWHKEDGDRVEAGEVIFSVETDKAVQEVEALESGILRIPPESPPPGKPIPVGTVVGYLLEPGEPTPNGELAGRGTPVLGPAPATTPPAPASTPIHSPARRAQVNQPAISPRAMRLAVELGVDWTRLEGSGSGGRIVERDVRGAAAGHFGPQGQASEKGGGNAAES